MNNPLESKFAPRWIERMKNIIPNTEWDDFLTSCITPLPKTVRITKDLKPNENFTLKDIAQIPEAKYIEVKDQKPVGKLLPHFTGQMYAATLSSLLAIQTLDPQPEEKILDMCSSPGSKTTFIANRMNNTGVLIANESNGQRIPALKQNLDRMGVCNTLVTQYEGQKLTQFFGEEFDRILLDAPCSSDGHGRKESKFFTQNWRERDIFFLSKIQKELIVSAFEMLSLDGILLYSTCTGAPEENEAVVQYLLDMYPDEAELLPITLTEIPHRKGIESFIGQKICSKKTANSVIRLFPHLKKDNWDSEFFFLARIGKKRLTQRQHKEPQMPNSPYETLKKNRIAEILAIFRKQYGIENQHFKSKTMLEREKAISLVTPEIPSFLKRIKAQHTGLHIYSRDKGLPTMLAQHFGKYATNNVYELNEQECSKFLYGYDIPLSEDHSFHHGQELIVRYQQQGIGIGKVVNHTLKNKLGKNEILRG